MMASSADHQAVEKNSMTKAPVVSDQTRTECSQWSLFDCRSSQARFD
jgi:hypothetical protein